MRQPTTMLLSIPHWRTVMSLRAKIILIFFGTLLANSAIMITLSLPPIKKSSIDSHKLHLERRVLSILTELKFQNEHLEQTGLASMYLDDAKALTLNKLSGSVMDLHGDEGILLIDLSSETVLRRYNTQAAIEERIVDHIFSIQKEKNQKNEDKHDVHLGDHEVGLPSLWVDDLLVMDASFEPWNWAIVGYASRDTLETDVSNLLSKLLVGLGISLVISLFIATGILVKIKDIEQSNELLEGRVKERTEELIKSNQELENSVQKGKGLIRVLSHDLANSIGLIQSTINLIPTVSDEKREKYLEKLTLATSNQMALIDQVRTLEANESGKHSIVLEKVDLGDILDRALKLMEHKIKEKEIIVNRKIDGANLLALAEPVTLLNSVIANLISNAIKFSLPQGVIEISLEEDSDYLKMQVEDHGIGMPETLIKKIFSPFHSTSRKGTSGEKGTGFGMPLAKSYMDQYGGEIKVESIDRQVDPDHSGTKIILIFRREEG